MAKGQWRKEIPTSESWGFLLEVIFPKGGSEVLPFVPYPFVEALVGCRRFESSERFDVWAEFDVVETRLTRNPRLPRETSSSTIPCCF